MIKVSVARKREKGLVINYIDAVFFVKGSEKTLQNFILKLKPFDLCFYVEVIFHDNDIEFIELHDDLGDHRKWRLHVYRIINSAPGSSIRVIHRYISRLLSKVQDLTLRDCFEIIYKNDFDFDEFYNRSKEAVERYERENGKV